MSYTKNIELLNRYLQRERKLLNELNIKFKYSVMELTDYEGVTYTKTSDYPNKVAIANTLRSQGLSYYTLYASQGELPMESEIIKHCVLGKLNQTCADCGMKCYLENIDIVAIAR